MANEATHWGRVLGSGQIYDGPCIVTDIIMYPASNQNYTDVYDGRDATSGERFCRVRSAQRTTQHISLAKGVLFGRGIYVVGEDAAVETTVTFVPLS